MADDKVYTQEVIEDTPFPQEDGTVPYTDAQSTSGEIYSQKTIKPQTMPTKRVAVELIGSMLNTKSKKILGEFQFTKNGAIQVGEYTNGVSGDIRISPNGITARNLSGLTTFSLDGDNGDAVFAGTIQAGTLISGVVAVGDGDILIDGESKQMIWYTDGIPSIIIGEIE